MLNSGLNCRGSCLWSLSQGGIAVRVSDQELCRGSLLGEFGLLIQPSLPDRVIVKIR